MVRAKKTAPNEGEAETRQLLESLQQKFKEDLIDLEAAKRDFSSTFAKEIIERMESATPAGVMDMRAVDFIATINGSGGGGGDHSPMKTPVGAGAGKLFKSVETPSGVRLQIPATISTRIDGAILKSRVPRQGEVLFSLHGTPVFIEE